VPVSPEVPLTAMPGALKGERGSVIPRNTG
jgi:hypothetical protein